MNNEYSYFHFIVIADIIIITTEKIENDSVNNLLRKSMPKLH